MNKYKTFKNHGQQIINFTDVAIKPSIKNTFIFPVKLSDRRKKKFNEIMIVFSKSRGFSDAFVFNPVNQSNYSKELKRMLGVILGKEKGFTGVDLRRSYASETYNKIEKYTNKDINNRALSIGHTARVHSQYRQVARFIKDD